MYSVTSLVLEILKQLQKEAIRQPNSALVKRMMEIALAFLNDSLAKYTQKEIAKALKPLLVETRIIQQATKEGTKVGKQVTKEAAEVGIRETAKEVTEEVGKRVSIKTAAKLAKESTRGVFRRALAVGAVVDGAVCACEVAISAKRYHDGKISGRELGCRSVRSVSAAAGSTFAGAGGAVAGTFAGGLLGSIVPGIGTAIGGSVGGLIGSVVAGTAGSIGGAQAGKYINQAVFTERFEHQLQ